MLPGRAGAPERRDHSPGTPPTVPAVTPTPRVPMAIFDRPASQRRWNPIEQRVENTGLSSSLSVARSTKASTASPNPLGRNSWTIASVSCGSGQCSGAGRAESPAHPARGGAGRVTNSSHFRSNQ